MYKYRKCISLGILLSTCLNKTYTANQAKTGSVQVREPEYRLLSPDARQALQTVLTSYQQLLSPDMKRMYASYQPVASTLHKNLRDSKYELFSDGRLRRIVIGNYYIRIYRASNQPDRCCLEIGPGETLKDLDEGRYTFGYKDSNLTLVVLPQAIDRNGNNVELTEYITKEKSMPFEKQLATLLSEIEKDCPPPTLSPEPVKTSRGLFTLLSPSKGGTSNKPVK